MSKVILKDVVIRVKDKVDKDTTELEYYIGGEHFDNGEVVVSKKGIIKDSTIGPAFHMRFKPGDVLLMSRNPHLRKAGVVDFEGICSDVSYVCRTRDNNVLLQEYLPFIFQSDHFWNFAEENKKGSTNFFLNWSDFEKYEFDLPSVEKQEELADVLWAAVNTKMAYQKLLYQTDELVKSQFIEMFGDPIDNPMGWMTSNIGSVTEDILSGQCLNGDAKQLQPGQKAVLKVSAVTYGYFKNDEYKVLRDPSQITKGIYPKKGDLLFSRANTKEYVGATALVDQDYPDLMLPDKLWKIVFKPEIDTIFAKHFLSHPQVRNVLSSLATGTSGSMYNISMEKLRNLTIIIPPLERQREYVLFVEQTDKSKFELMKSIEKLQGVIRTIQQQNLTD